MSNLDDKLKEILTEDYCYSIYPKESGDNIDYKALDKLVAEIKQAFADEYWLTRKRLNIYPDDRLMTGREWYDRFEKEIDSSTHYIRSLFREGYPTATKADNREMFVERDVLEAAKKAAGSK